MDIKQSKELIILLSAKWKIHSPINPDLIIDKLYKKVTKSYNATDTFEFSLVPFEKSIRFIHLNFYKPNLPKETIKILIQRREDSIVDIVKSVNKGLRLNYNEEALNYFFSLLNDVLWPVQFGCEIGRGSQPLIKVYFSVAGDNSNCRYMLEKIYRYLGFSQSRLKDCFLKQEIDAIGIDFYSSGNYKIKIYPFYRFPFNLPEIKGIYKKYQKKADECLNSFLGLTKEKQIRHMGFLYRLSDVAGKVESAKLWVRFDKPFKPSLLKPKDSKPQLLKRWWDYSSSIIESMDARISYLTIENNMLGVYFR